MDRKDNPIKRLLDRLGPGLITGASDDDPSGIGTYSQAGAALGYATLWTAIVTLPLMIVVQHICAKIGMCSGRGLAGVLHRYYSKKAALSRSDRPCYCKYYQRRRGHCGDSGGDKYVRSRPDFGDGDTDSSCDRRASSLGIVSSDNEDL